MIDNPVSTARLLAQMLDQRGVGHTSMMQVGFDNHRGDAILIGATPMQAHDISAHRRINRDMFRTHVTSLQSLPTAAGLRGAVAIDHHALSTLLHGLIAENIVLKGRIDSRTSFYESESARIHRRTLQESINNR